MVTTRQRVTVAALVVGVAVVLTGGCTVDNNQDCEARTVDLRQPPTRNDLDMPDGESVATWSCDAGFELTILFPGDVSLELTSRELGTDSRGAEDQETGNPTTIDVQSTWLSIDDAADLAERIADSLGMDPSQIESWRQDARNPPDPTLDTKTRFIPGSAGYVDADLRVIHQSGEKEEDNRNNVHLILYLAGTSS